MEAGGVDLAVALELRPESVFAGAGKDDVELDLVLVGVPGRVDVYEVEEVGAGVQEVAPGAEPGLDTLHRVEIEEEHGAEAGDGFGGVGTEVDFEVGSGGLGEWLGWALDVKGGGDELGGASGGVEVREDAVEAGKGKLGMKTEVAVGFRFGVFVGEVLPVFADQEEVQQAFVDLFEFLDAAVGFWVGDVEAEGGGLGGLWCPGDDFEVEAVFEWVGEAGDEVHAAFWAAAGEFGMDVGVHGAGEVGEGLRG